MKTTITAAATSMFCGGFSMAMAAPHPLLSNVAALVGIVVGVMTAFSILLNMRKVSKETRIVDLETTHMILQRCKECTSPEDCVFTSEAKPSFCHYKNHPGSQLPEEVEKGKEAEQSETT